VGIHNARLASELAARLDEIRRQAEELSASRITALATGRASSSPTAAVASLCGVERWHVKTLTDP